MKKLFATVVALTLVLSMLLPMFVLPAYAASYVATGTLNTKVRLSEFETNSISGQTHTPRKYYFYNVKGASNVEGKQAYCININVGFKGKDLTAYKGWRPADSTYFKSLSATKQKGIVLTMAFGYPSNTYKALGADNANQAIAATQILVWEFLTGVRTSFTGNPTNTWAKAGLSGKALTAYNRILALINEYVSDGGEYTDLLTNAEVLIWDNGDNAQQMITYTGTAPIHPRGAIEVIKKDNNGNNLAGAMFTAVNTVTKKEYSIGPTDSNGYAITKGGKDDPQVDYGTYRVYETAIPSGYTAIGDTAWTVTVDKNTPVVTLQATNRKNASVRIVKTSEPNRPAYYQNKQFGIYDAQTDLKLFTLTTDVNGETQTAQLPGDGTYYAKEENVEGCSVEWRRDGKWEKGNRFTFTVPDDADANGVVYLQAKNLPLPGTVTVKKTSEDGIVAGFKMEIKDTNGNVRATGRTDLTGTLVEDTGYRWVDFLDEYSLLLRIPARSWANPLNFAFAKYCLVVQPYTTVGEIREILKEKGFTDHELWTNNYKLCTQDDSEAIVNPHNEEYSLDWGFASPYNSETGSYFINAHNVLIVVAGGTYIWDADDNGNPIGDPYIDSLNASWAEWNIGATGQTFIVSSTSDSENDYASYALFLALDVNRNAVIDEEDASILREANTNKSTLPTQPIQLPAGSYVLSEVLDPTGHSRYIPPEDKTFVVEPNKNTEIFMHNRLKKTGIYITKTAQDGVVANVPFHVTGTLENGTVFDITTTTDEDGVIWITQDSNQVPVTIGTYTITELNVPSRYVTPKSQTVTITEKEIDAGEPITVVFNNTLKPVMLSITKTSEDSVVAGITFNVSGTAISGQYINQNFVTDERGTIAINVRPGKYTVVEVMDAFGKYVAQEPVVIHPHYDENGVAQDNKVSFHNIRKKFTLQLTKIDGLTGQVFGDATLDGAVYGLYKDGVLVERATTANGGKLSFSTRYCDLGYTVQEISPSVGYQLDPTVYDVQAAPMLFSDETNEISLIVKEQPIMGYFNIIKEKGFRDIKVSEAGAEFQVWLKSAGSYEAAAEEERDILVTDSADPDDPMGYDGGVATSKDLPYGVYVVHQVKGDDRFELAEDFEIVINEDRKTESYTVFNTAKPHPVVLTKTDLGGIVLDGAVFAIYDEQGTEVFRGTTDEEGKVTAQLYPGTYTWKELQAPETYAINHTVNTFTMDIYGVVTGSVTLANDVVKYTVKKTDQEGNALSGATFQLVDDSTGNVVDTQVSGPDGLATFSKLKKGTYTVKETAVPAGYTLSSQTLHFTVGEQWTNKAVGEFNDIFVNGKTSITLTKVDETTSAPLAAAEITVFDQSGKEYTKGITNESGQFTIVGIVPGEYTFKETAVPAGYQLNTNTFRFTVSEIGEITGDREIKDKPTVVVLTKIDSVTTQKLPGAEITVYDDQGSVYYKGITGEDGTVILNGITPGKYTFKETLVPAGYQLNPKTYSFVVDKLGAFSGESTITNDPTRVTITKTDLNGEKILSGAEIAIYDQQGSVVASARTGVEGTISATYLKPGKYTFKEVKAPNGYALNTSDGVFVIDENGNIDGQTTITDDVTRLKIHKINHHSEPLADVEFTMYDSNNDVVMTKRSNQNGEVEFFGFTEGSYIIRETETLSGYILPEVEISVENDGEWDNEAGYSNITVINEPLIGDLELDYQEPDPTEQGVPEEGTPDPSLVPKTGDPATILPAAMILFSAAALYVFLRLKERSDS